MTKTAERILIDALTLDVSDRSDLIDELLVRSRPCTDPDYIAAWESEIGRRLSEINAGKSQPIPWKQAIEQIGRGEIDGE